MTLDNPSAENQLQDHLRGCLPTFDPTIWPGFADSMRSRIKSEIYLRGLPVNVLAGSVTIEWGGIIEREAYLIRKLRFRVIDRYWVPALLYEPVGRLPEGRIAVLNAGGHHDSGKAAVYSQIRSVNLAKRGVLSLSFEFVGMGELAADAEADLDSGASLHHGLAALELVGMGAASIMFVAMSRALDILLEHPDTDPERVAVTGLSGGGWQALILAALDTRIKLVVPVAGFTSTKARVDITSDVGDIEQVPADLAALVDYTDLTAMLAPRPTLLIFNEVDDCCFQALRTRKEVYDPVIPVFKAAGAAENFEFYSNTEPGSHNYDADNRSRLYKFLATHFGGEWSYEDIHVAAEICNEQELIVGVSEEQMSIREIAAEHARQLTRTRFKKVQTSNQLRKKVAGVLRLTKYVSNLPQTLGQDSWRQPVQVGPWMLPAVWNPGNGKLTITIADEVAVGVPPVCDSASLKLSLIGLAGMVCSLERVLMLQSLGQRLLGIQVAQLLGVTRKVIELCGEGVQLSAHGLNSTVVATLAAALNPGLFSEVQLSGHRLVQIDDLIHRGISPTKAVALFCPDLLTVTNVFDLRSLLGTTVLVESGRG